MIVQLHFLTNFFVEHICYNIGDFGMMFSILVESKMQQLYMLNEDSVSLCKEDISDCAN